MIAVSILVYSVCNSFISSKDGSVSKWNLFVILLLVQAAYVGIRTYVCGCKRARGYY